MSGAEILRIAAESGFSETAYAMPQGDGWRMRYFSPASEVPFRGHATAPPAGVSQRAVGKVQRQPQPPEPQRQGSQRQALQPQAWAHWQGAQRQSLQPQAGEGRLVSVFWLIFVIPGWTASLPWKQLPA